MTQEKNSKETGNPADAGVFKLRYAFYLALTLLIVLSLLTHNAADNSILDGGSEGLIQNWIGYAGAYFSRYCFFIFLALPLIRLSDCCLFALYVLYCIIPHSAVDIPGLCWFSFLVRRYYSRLNRKLLLILPVRSA